MSIICSVHIGEHKVVAGTIAKHIRKHLEKKSPILPCWEDNDMISGFYKHCLVFGANFIRIQKTDAIYTLIAEKRNFKKTEEKEDEINRFELMDI